MLLGAALGAAAQPQQPRPGDRRGDTETPAATFRSGVTLMTTVVIPRDGRGVFLANLTADDFLVFEDDQAQQVVSLVQVLGGRAGGQLAPARRLPGGVIVLPPPAARAAGEAVGRFFVILVDDLHIEAGLPLRTRAVFEQLTENLIPEGALFGIVSTGLSAIAIDPTGDQTLLDGVAARITGDGFDPNELVENFRRTGRECRS